MARYDEADRARSARIERLCEAWQAAGGGGVGVCFVPVDVVAHLLEQGAVIEERRRHKAQRKHRMRELAGSYWMARLNGRVVE